MPKLQKKPAAHKRGHPKLQNINFFYFCWSFLPSWIRIRIPNTDPDPLARLNTDPIRIRIRNPGHNGPTSKGTQKTSCTLTIHNQCYISIDICEQLYLKEKVVHGNKLRRLPKNTWPVTIIGMPPI